MRKTATLLLMILSLGAQAGSAWVINEFQYDPDTTNGDANGDGTADFSQDEFVEIYNDTGGDVDISGWTLADGAQVRHTFPANTVVPNQCAIVVFGGGTPTGTFGESLVQTASTGSIGLGNSGDSMVLNDGLSDVATAAYVDNQGDNQSLTRDPDITGATFDPHSTATGSSTLFSPGTRIDGSQFSGCPVAMDTPPSVSDTTPADGAVAVSINSTITVDFDEDIDATASAVTVTCGGMSQSFSGLPFSGDELVITPAGPLPFDATCAVTVLAAEVTDQDGTIDNMAADYNFSFTVESAAQSQIDLILNEYQADPDPNNGDANGDGTVDTSEDEFVEIYNNGPNPVDISGWTLSDGFGVRHTFAANTILNSCEAVVVFGGGTPTGSFGGSQAVVASDGSLGLNNGGDSIILNDGQSDRINVTYGGSGTDESYTLDPDITGLSYVGHIGATGSGGALFSPGTQIDGSAFVACGVDNAPEVTSTTPADAAVDVLRTSNVVINFSEAVDIATNAVNIDCSSSGVQNFPVALTNNVTSLDIDAADFDTAETCTVTVDDASVTDLDGSNDPMAADYVFSFTVIDDQAPTVTSTDPADGSVGFVNNANMVINFNESVDATIDAATMLCSISGKVGFSGLPINDVSQITLDPDTDLVDGETCDWQIAAAEITDNDGTPDNMAANVNVSFTVGFPVVEIFEIQGAGLASPFDGQRVTTLDNIVTAVDTNGFYMQTPDNRDDADLQTSNGIFVFTGGAPTVLVGDQVDLTGDIVEFFDLTEFTNPGTYVLNIDGSGNPLPTAIVLDDNFPSGDPSASPCDDPTLAYECFEGMHFTMPQGFISAASVSFFGANRDDQLVRAGSARAFREPGIEFPGLPGLPVFDGNPELLEMDIDALGLDLAANSYPAGSEIAVTGVFGFDFGEYEIWPSSVTLLTENTIPAAVRDAVTDEVTIGSANLFRLFNDVDDPGTEDDGQVEDSLVYAARLQKLANYVINDMKAPVILGLQEIENIDVMNDLVTAIATAGGPAYTAALVEGNDQGGIDVAYLYQTALLSNVTITQLGAAEINTFDGSLLHDRPPLRLEADVALTQDSLSLNVLVVHMRSRSGIDDPVDGDRVRSKRLQQANSVAEMIDGIVTEDPDKPLYVVGDFNAFQFTDGYVDVVGQITGTAVAADNLVWEAPLFAANPLTQAAQTLVAEQQYSFVFRGSAQVLDNAIMNDEGLMLFSEMQYVRGQADANLNNEDDDSTSLRSTDHDGFVLFVFYDTDLIFKNGFD